MVVWGQVVLVVMDLQEHLLQVRTLDMYYKVATHGQHLATQMLSIE